MPDALVPAAPGRLGLTFLPGKRGASFRYPGHTYRRDAADRPGSACASQGVVRLILLVEDASCRPGAIRPSSSSGRGRASRCCGTRWPMARRRSRLEAMDADPGRGRRGAGERRRGRSPAWGAWVAPGRSRPAPWCARAAQLERRSTPCARCATRPRWRRRRRSGSSAATPRAGRRGEPSPLSPLRSLRRGSAPWRRAARTRASASAAGR